MVEAVIEGTVAFQGLLEPFMRKTQVYMHLIYVPAKDTWTKALSKNIDRMAQGVGKRIKGTNTFF